MILGHPVGDSLKKADLIALFLVAIVNDSHLSGHILFPSSYPLQCTNGLSKFFYNGHRYSKSALLPFLPRKMQEL